MLSTGNTVKSKRLIKDMMGCLTDYGLLSYLVYGCQRFGEIFCFSLQR